MHSHSSNDMYLPTRLWAVLLTIHNFGWQVDRDLVARGGACAGFWLEGRGVKGEGFCLKKWVFCAFSFTRSSVSSYGQQLWHSII